MAKQLKIDPKTQLARAKVLKNQVAYDPQNYTYSDSFVEASTPAEAHTVPELLRFARNKEIEIEARVLAYGKGSKGPVVGYKKLDTTGFLEAFQKNKGRKFREMDSFLTDSGFSPGNSLVGDDFIPLLGGPFNKQLYYYDYLRMHALCFYAVNHDPVARRVVEMTKSFVLGAGYRTDVKGKDKDRALAVWRALEKVNNFEEMLDNSCRELSIYGEQMVWKLPFRATKIGYDLPKSQAVPTALLPRYRLIDPSCIWEIVTYPEDISRVLFYQWIAPTQYQMYTGRDGGQSVPSTKFIYQQIPAEEIKHYKINSVSNEKRGRSDLFAALGFMKRLRDSVDYSIIRDQKNSAWSIDTEIAGSQTDIDAYVESQQSLGTIPNAGSEFVHSAAVKRTYLGNQGSGQKSGSNAFDWCLSMICMATGIPINYFGSHISGAQTRASAVTMTEPVVKVFEERQKILRKILTNIAEDVFRDFKLDAELEVTFPEIMPQDRTAKIKDVMLAEQQRYISHQRASEIVAKELGIDEYEYETEQKQIDSEPAIAPLSAPPMGDTSDPKQQGLTNEDEADIKKQAGY